MKLAISIILAFFTIRGFRYTITDAGLVLRNTESFIWLLLFIFFILVIRKALNEKDKKLARYSLLFGLIVGLCYILGISMEKMKNISWIWKNFGHLTNMLNLFYSWTVSCSCAAFLAFPFLRKYSEKEAAKPAHRFHFKNVLLFWLILTIIFLPWYSFCFPGVITQDSADQIDDAITVNSIRDHHSAFLDLVMRAVILPIRHVTGSLQLGVAACSLLQMLIMTFVFAFTYEWSRQYLRSHTLRVLVFLSYAFYPVNYFFSVTLWKDILFSIGFLALLILLDSVAQNKTSFFKSRKKMLLLSVMLVLLPLMRHNGLSIAGLVFIYMFIYFSDHRKQTAMIFGVFLLLFCAWRFLLLPALRFTPIASSNGLSIFEQQMARALNVHHEELSEEEMAEYTKYFYDYNIWSRYNPYISDPVKRNFRNDLYEEDPLGFFRCWLKLGRRYPIDYFEAFLANNYGYWFPETHSGIVSRGVNEMGEIEDIHFAPLVNFGIMQRVFNFIDTEQYLKTPLVPLLFSLGAYFWLWIFCGCYCLYCNRKKFILFIAGLSLWMGILISPVYNEFRYVYGLFLGLPLVLVCTLTKHNSQKQLQDNP